MFEPNETKTKITKRIDYSPSPDLNVPNPVLHSMVTPKEQLLRQERNNQLAVSMARYKGYRLDVW
jgi:hypothetical protein